LGYYKKADMRDTSDHSTQTDRTGRYTLGLAMLIVRQVETSDTRSAVFEEIKAKNRIIRWVDRLYSLGGASVIRRLMLCLYMLKCAGAVAGRPAPEIRALAMANFANEAYTITRVTALVLGLPVLMVRPSLRNVLKPAQIMAMVRIIGCIPRLWCLLGRLSRCYSFMPACRIASALAYYIRFGEILESGPTSMGAIIASNYSPEAVGLAAAAHQKMRRVVYVNHAPVPRNSPYVPPVLTDLSVFYGDVVRKTYELRSRFSGASVNIGQPGDTADMAYSMELQRVGVFLTALTRKDTISRLVTEIRAVHPNIEILIRHHPVTLLETDLTDLTDKTPGITVTLGTPLAEDIGSCDAIICGNSGVILNALRGGRPVAYLPALDTLPLDYNGFLESRLVPRIDGWDTDTFAGLCRFYQAPQWPATMVGHDASYGQSREQIDQDVRTCLISVLSA